jgi:hypothetical protein
MRRRRPLTAIDRKVPVVITQSRNLKERLITNGRGVAFHVCSLFDVTNEEHNLGILFLCVVRVCVDDCFHIAYSYESTHLLHFVDLVYIGGIVSKGTKSMQIGV